jgi:outer membrane protein assembly factor BamB
MTDVDFITRLEQELSEAERRQELDGLPSRALTAARGWAPSRAGLIGSAVAAAAVVIAIVVGAGVLDRQGREANVSPPREVARLTLGDSGLPDLAVGFGSTWIGSEYGRHTVIRVDPAKRRVVARIPAGPLISGLVSTDDAVWVVVNPDNTPTELLRIDPHTNRVTARVPVSANTVDRGLQELGPHLLGGGRALWLVSTAGGARIDPGTGRVMVKARWHLASGAYARQWALADDAIWVHATNGQLLRFNARTGAREASISSAPGTAGLAAVPGGDAVLAGNDGTVIRVDGATGHSRWGVRLPDGVAGDRSVIVAGDTVWVLRSDNARALTRLIALDLGSGRTRASTVLPGLGAGSLLVVGDQLWFTNASGQVVVIKP